MTNACSGLAHPQPGPIYQPQAIVSPENKLPSLEMSRRVQDLLSQLHVILTCWSLFLAPILSASSAVTSPISGEFSLHPARRSWLSSRFSGSACLALALTSRLPMTQGSGSLPQDPTLPMCWSSQQRSHKSPKNGDV